MFSDILLTVDFDRTLTATDSSIPQRNLEAIQYFMDNGGAFTVNTGRSISTFGETMKKIPVNAPFLLYNGSAACRDGVLEHCVEIQMDVWQTVDALAREFPEMNLEIQGADLHYLVAPEPAYVAFYDALKWGYRIAEPGEDLGPFMKFALAGSPKSKSVATLFDISEKEDAQFDAAQNRILELWEGKVEVYRAAPRIIDVHAKGVSTGAAAVELKKKLGIKILVCVGDADNDITMLDAADYPFCPAESVVADLYPNVCNCAEGAVADVIYKKIPEILGILP